MSIVRSQRSLLSNIIFCPFNGKLNTDTHSSSDDEGIKSVLIGISSLMTEIIFACDSSIIKSKLVEHLIFLNDLSHLKKKSSVLSH